MIKKTVFNYDETANYVFNSDGYGYGLFPSSTKNPDHWSLLDDRTKGAELINLYENVLEQNINPADYFQKLRSLITDEDNQLLLNRMLSQLETIYWNF